MITPRHGIEAQKLPPSPLSSGIPLTPPRSAPRMTHPPSQTSPRTFPLPPSPYSTSTSPSTPIRHLNPPSDAFTSPRRIPSPSKAKKQPNDFDPRQSTTSQYSSIGLQLLSEDYSDDEDSIRLPRDPRSASSPSPVPQYRSGAHVVKGYQDVERDSLAGRVCSLEGEVDGARSERRVTFHEDGGNGSSGGFGQHLNPTSLVSNGILNNSPRSDQIRPPTIVDFPSPTMSRSAPFTPPSQITPAAFPTSHRANNNQSPNHYNQHNGRQRPSIQTSVHVLPPSSSPISPFLAAPPPAHYSQAMSSPTFAPPISPFAAPSRPQSSDNASIRGFEVMLKKKALFRGGEEELMVPFSPRGNPGQGGIGGYPRVGKVGMGRGVSGVDFWKRFSVSARLDEAEKAGKDDSWLAREEKKKLIIKRAVIIVLIAILLIVGGVVAYVVVSNKPVVISSSSVVTSTTPAKPSTSTSQSPKTTA